MPFVFVAALSVVNLLILLFVFQNQQVDADSHAMRLLNPIASLLDAVRIKDIRTYALLLLLMLVGWNTFFSLSVCI